MGEMPKKKRNLRLVRRLKVYGFVTLLVMLFLTVLVRMPFFKYWLKGFVEDQLEATLGARVQIEVLDLTLLPLELELSGVKVWGETDAIIAIDHVAVDFDWGGLGGVNTLHVERPSCALLVVDGEFVELPGLSWGDGGGGGSPWDNLSIEEGDFRFYASNGRDEFRVRDVWVEPTGHAVADARIGHLVLRSGEWRQSAENVSLRGLILTPDKAAVETFVLNTPLLRVEGGVERNRLQNWSGDLAVAATLDELNGLIPESTQVSGFAEAKLSVGGTGPGVMATGPMKASVTLEREGERRRSHAFRQLEGELSLGKGQWSVNDAKTPWREGELSLGVDSDYGLSHTTLEVAGSGVSMEQVLKSDFAFRAPWVETTTDFSARLSGSLRPYSLSGDARLLAQDLRVVPGGLRPDQVETFALERTEAKGRIHLDAHRSYFVADELVAPDSNGRAEVSLSRGAFPELLVDLDLPLLDFSLLQPFGGVELGGRGSLTGKLWGRLGEDLQVDALVDVRRFEALGLEWADRLKTRMRSRDLKTLSFQPVHAYKGNSLLQGSLELDFRPEELELSVDLVLEDTHIEDLLNIVEPLPGVDGIAEGTVSLSGPPEALNGEVDLDLHLVDLFGESFPEGSMDARVQAGRIVVDPLFLHRNAKRESVRFRGAVDSWDWSLLGEIHADALTLEPKRLGSVLDGTLYADVGLTGSLMSPIPKGRLALRDGRFLSEDVGISVLSFERIDDEIVWVGELFEDTLSVRAVQELGGLWGYSLEGGWRSFPAHVAYPVAADGASIASHLDGGFVFQGNWREGRDSVHGRASAERFVTRWRDYELSNDQPWTVDVLAGKLIADDLGLRGSGMEVNGDLSWGKQHLKGGATGTLLLELLPALSPGIEQSQGPVEVTLDVDTARVSGPTARLEAVTTGANLRTEWFPHAMESFTARLLASEQGYSVSGLSGALGGGRFSIDGHVHAEEWRPKRYDLQGVLTDGRIRYFSFLPALEGDARLSLEGPVDQLMLSGDVELDDVRFSDRIDWEEWVLDVRESKLVEEVETTESDPLFALDLRVVGKGTARIRNNLAHGNADVDLQVTGDSERPGVLGTVRMLPGGRIFVQDREFDVERAELHYVDPWSFDPDLDILLNTEVRSREESYRIDYRVGGPFSDWYTVANSEPALSQADINGLLLFGLTREELERFGGVNSALLMEGADFLLHGVGLDNRALDRFGGRSLPFDRVELVTGVSERGSQVNSETRILLEKQIADPYNFDVRLEFNPFRNVENYLELEKQVGDSFYMTLYRSSLEQERAVNLGGAYGLDFKVRWERE